MKQRQPIFKKSIITLSVCIIITLIYVQKGDKERSYFQSVSGVITSLENTHERYAGKDTSKFRYVQIDNYPHPFQIFIGKSTGDFEPKFEQLNHLKIGDSITVYFEETTRTRREAVNNLAYFIDKGNEALFIKGNSINKLLYGLVVFCGIIMIILLILKKKGKII
jgi:uncharacterized membrane protein